MLVSRVWLEGRRLTMITKAIFYNAIRELKACHAMLKENALHLGYREGMVKTMTLVNTREEQWRSGRSNVQELINLCEDIVSEFQMKEDS
jgi:hypothetical protein